MLCFAAGLISTGREAHQVHYLLLGWPCAAVPPLALVFHTALRLVAALTIPHYIPAPQSDPKLLWFIIQLPVVSEQLRGQEGRWLHVSRKDVVQHLKVHVFPSIPHSLRLRVQPYVPTTKGRRRHAAKDSTGWRTLSSSVFPLSQYSSKSDSLGKLWGASEKGYRFC